jgi:hypothetical protein
MKKQPFVYKLSSTNELLTARIGLLATAHTVTHLKNLNDPKYRIICADKGKNTKNTLLLVLVWQTKTISLQKDIMLIKLPISGYLLYKQQE